MKINFDIYSTPEGPHIPPELRMLRLTSGALVAQAIYIFAYLGIPDLLRNGPKTAQHLAKEAGANALMLSRLMRFLSTIDVVTELAPLTFDLTRVGGTLCRSHRSAIRDNALLIGAPFYWNAMGELLHQIQTGENSFTKAHCTDLFSYLATHADAATAFSAAMESSAELSINGILSTYDFSHCRWIVDVGGGRGALLRGVLKRYQSVRGTLYDSESVLTNVTINAAMEPRLARVAGNFLDSVVIGADTYILHRVLHDWSDENAIRIVRNCRKAMLPTGRLLVIETSPECSPNNWSGLDLLMMMMLDGKERTELELRSILLASDFKTNMVLRSNPYWIFEAVPQ